MMLSHAPRQHHGLCMRGNNICINLSYNNHDKDLMMMTTRISLSYHSRCHCCSLVKAVKEVPGSRTVTMNGCHRDNCVRVHMTSFRVSEKAYCASPLARPAHSSFAVARDTRRDFGWMGAPAGVRRLNPDRIAPVMCPTRMISRAGLRGSGLCGRLSTRVIKGVVKDPCACVQVP